MLNESRLTFEYQDRKLGLTEISRRVFAALGMEIEPNAKLWRKNYQSHFLQACKFETSSISILQSALDEFVSLARLDGKPLDTALESALSADLVRIEKIGTAKKGLVVRDDKASWFSVAENFVAQRIAEPGLLEAATELDSGLDVSKAPLLISFAGAAELAPTLNWLRWGGRVLVLARRGNTNWKSLIAQAQISGELLVPVKHGLEGELSEIAGMDLVWEPELAASAIGKISSKESVIFGHYGYAPGYKHVELQAIAETLTRIVKARFSKVLLSWLATPSDSVIVATAFAQQREIEFNSRSLFRKIIDLPWQALGYLKAPKHLPLEENPELAVIDCSANLQGPSYSLAKRLQRWRAALEAFSGNTVAYQITPPSETDSVLSYKILRATYKGGPSYGSTPVSVAEGNQWPAALLALTALQGKPKSIPEAYLDTAIHGGLWRTKYETETIWIPATVTGLLKFWTK